MAVTMTDMPLKEDPTCRMQHVSKFALYFHDCEKAKTRQLTTVTAC